MNYYAHKLKQMFVKMYMDDQENVPPFKQVVHALPPARPLTQNGYTVPELMRLARMTRRQVMYWAHIGLVNPTFQDLDAAVGQPAYFYSTEAVVKALIICELRRRGCSLRQVQQIAQNLQEHDVHLEESRSYLLTDGYSVYYAFSHDEVVDILRQHRQMLLLVPIHEQVAKLQEAA